MLRFEHYCGPVRVDAQKAEIVRPKISRNAHTALIRRIVLESLYYEMTAKQELGAHIKKKLKKRPDGT